MPLQIHADLFLHHAPIGLLFLIRAFERLGDDLPGGLDKVGALARNCESAAHDFGQAFDAARVAVDGDDGEHDAVFGEMPAVADHHLLHHVIHAAGVDADAAGGHGAGFARALAVDLEDLAGIHHEALFESGVSQVLGEAGMLGELAELAVDGHEVARANQVQHQAHLLDAAVAGDVDRRIHAAVHDVGAAAGHVVDHAEDRLLVARNDARAEHHGIALFDGDVFVIVHRDARERGHRLALGAADQDCYLGGCGLHYVLWAQEDTVRNIKQSIRVGDLGDGDHAAADDGHAAAALGSEIEHELDAMDGAREARDDDAALGAVEDFFHARADGALAFGVAGTIGVGGIGEKQEHAALAVVGERVEVEELVVGGSGIDLEIARVDDDAERRGDGDRDRAHDRVRDMDELDFERPDFDGELGLDLDEIGLAFKIVFLEAALDERERECRAVDGHVDFSKKVRHGADVVFMAVREDERANLTDVLLEKSQVGHHQVDAEQLGIGEHHATIDDDHVIAVADGGHVHAELAESAERYHLQLLISHS